MIDLCVFLAGQNLDTYTPLFFETLYRNCDISKIDVHVIEKGRFEYTGDYSEEVPWYTVLDLKYYIPGVGDKVHNYLLKKQQEAANKFNIYEMHDPELFFKKATPNKPFFYLGDDHAETMNWAMENCGTKKWVLFCHSDIVFKGDIISKFIPHMKDHVGILGIFSHCFAVNREAYYRVGIRFNSIANFRAEPVKHNGFDYEVRHASDPRGCSVDSKILYGWDVTELMQLIMIANGWSVDISNNNPNFVYYLEHMCSGHGYVNELTRTYQECRRVGWMQTYGIGRL